MTERNEQSPAARLAHLDIVFPARRARLASSLAVKPTTGAGPAPLIQLQSYGYAVAVLLAVTAALPVLIGFTFRRRKLLFGAVATILRLRRWRTRLNAIRTDESRR